MKKKLVKLAILGLPAVLWINFTLTSPAIAGDHYRIGTLNKSVHYRDDEDFNDTHDGVYLVHNRNIYGTYYNSEYEQSLFFARSTRLNGTFSFFYGVASGYELGVMPLVGLSAQLSILKVTLTQEAAVLGVEIPLL